jgi:polar amino acid transport system substrate-binding protein
MRLAVEQGTTTLQYVMDHIKPVRPLSVFPQTAPMFAALAAGQVDAVLFDTPTVLARAKQSNGAFRVAGRYDMGEKWGGLVNKESPNLPVFNKLIDDFKNDGTLQRLTDSYLTPGLGMDPAKLPVFTP